MGYTTLAASKIIEAYRAKTPGSERLACEASTLFPSGITHDARHLLPYGVYIARAQGSHKWDVDGNEYIDYFGGHGALLLGHNHPKVLAAAQCVLQHGTHFGANHSWEIQWAEWIRKLLPSAERVRFTASGTEATMMALRLARAFTGKNKIIRFKGHFHGWNDHLTFGSTSHFDGSPAAGVLASVAKNVVVLASSDVDELQNLLAQDPDIAGVILEPTGAYFGMVPLPKDFLPLVRHLTEQHGVVLIFDEVVTGFRVSPGGAQNHFGIRPDLTTLAKILAGGLPGGAVVGSEEIMGVLGFESSGVDGREKIQHQGTFNANPVSAAAGAVTLEIVATTDACQRATELAGSLRSRLNEVLESEGVAWGVYGEFSGFHIFTNPKQRDIRPSTFDPLECSFEELIANAPGLANKVRLAMLVQGVDFAGWPGGNCSAVHTEEDIDRTVEAFRTALKMLKEDEVL